MSKIRRFAVLSLFCLLGIAQRQLLVAQTSADEPAVRAVIDKEIDGWAKYDQEKVGSCYTADATWQNPFGVRTHSRAELVGFLKKLFSRPGYRSAKDTTPVKVTDLRILSPTSAVVWSEEKSEGQIDDSTGKPMAPRYSHYLEVLIKKDGQWLISDVMIMDEYPRPK